MDVTSRRSRGSERSAVLRKMLLVSDTAAASVGGLAVAAATGAHIGDAFTLAAGLAVAWPLIAFIFGLYATDDLSSWASGIGEAQRLLVALLFMSWPLLIAASVIGLPHAALSATAGALACGCLSALGRAGTRAAIHRAAPLRQRTVIVGSGVVANQLVEKLRFHQEFGLLPIGMVDDDVYAAGGAPDLPILGRLENLSEVLRLHVVDRVIIAFSRASHEDLLASIRVCRDHRVAVDVVPRLFELLDGARSLDQVGGMPLLSIGVARLNRASRAAKRLLDLTLAGGAVLLLWPLFLAIALAIKFESRGPVFFRQTRAGRNGKVFQVFKFRSMYADAEERKAEYVAINDRDDGVMFKIRKDPRVTRVGRLIRRFSLDELPQLLNVVRGEMSLVGPRPLILPEANAMAEDWQARRLDLRPGLTGPWQISGRSEVPFQEMLRFDYQYVSGWSLARDIEILLATVPAVLSGRGAY